MQRWILEQQQSDGHWAQVGCPHGYDPQTNIEKAMSEAISKHGVNFTTGDILRLAEVHSTMVVP